MIFTRLPKPEAFDGIRLRLISKWLMDADDRAVVVAFTSLHPGEGVTTVVAGLARSFGLADPGTVLAVDAGQGNRRIADLLKATKHQMSFDQLESGTFDLPRAIVHDEKSGAHILTLSEAGPSRPGSAAMARLVIEGLRPTYRLILLDAGALSAGWAPQWLAASGHRVLVVDASTATREVLDYQRRQFEDADIRLDGSILNKRTYPIPRLFYRLAH